MPWGQGIHLTWRVLLVHFKKLTQPSHPPNFDHSHMTNCICFLCGCKEEPLLKIFQNRVPREISGPHNVEVTDVSVCDKLLRLLKHIIM
jgi:hypothetical protein